MEKIKKFLTKKHIIYYSIGINILILFGILYVLMSTFGFNQMNDLLDVLTFLQRIYGYVKLMILLNIIGVLLSIILLKREKKNPKMILQHISSWFLLYMTIGLRIYIISSKIYSPTSFNLFDLVYAALGQVFYTPFKSEDLFFITLIVSIIFYFITTLILTIDMFKGKEETNLESKKISKLDFSRLNIPVNKSVLIKVSIGVLVLLLGIGIFMSLDNDSSTTSNTTPDTTYTDNSDSYTDDLDSEIKRVKDENGYTIITLENHNDFLFCGQNGQAIAEYNLPIEPPSDATEEEKDFINSIEVIVTPQDHLSIGDIVTVSLKYDPSEAERLKIKVVNKVDPVKVDKLVNDTTSQSKEYMFEYSDTKVLTSKQLKTLKNKDQLRVAKNEIYARHGLTFQTKALYDYFSQFSWYHPDPMITDAKQVNLNKIEDKNVSKLEKYRKKKIG